MRLNASNVHRFGSLVIVVDHDHRLIAVAVHPMEERGWRAIAFAGAGVDFLPARAQLRPAIASRARAEARAAERAERIARAAAERARARAAAAEARAIVAATVAAERAARRAARAAERAARRGLELPTFVWRGVQRAATLPGGGRRTNGWRDIVARVSSATTGDAQARAATGDRGCDRADHAPITDVGVCVDDR